MKLTQNQDVSHSNTFYQFVNLDDKVKFSQFKMLKKKQMEMGKKLKPIFKMSSSPGIFFNEEAINKSQIEEVARSLPEITKTNETELGDLLTQMNKHTITHMNLFSQ